MSILAYVACVAELNRYSARLSASHEGLRNPDRWHRRRLSSEAPLAAQQVGSANLTKFSSPPHLLRSMASSSSIVLWQSEGCIHNVLARSLPSGGSWEARSLPGGGGRLRQRQGQRWPNGFLALPNLTPATHCACAGAAESARRARAASRSPTRTILFRSGARHKADEAGRHSNDVAGVDGTTC